MPYVWAPGKFSGVPDNAHGYLFRIFNGLLFRLSPYVYAKFEIRFPVPEIIGGTQKIGESLHTPTLPFLQNFSWDFIRMDPLNVLAKFEICSFPRS